MRASETDDMLVEGYALKFDQETQIGEGKWGFKERISRTALDGAELDDVVFNFNHNNNDILARTKNGSLQLTVDNIGLKIVAKIIDTTAGRDIYRMIKDGLIDRMSFRARVKDQRWEPRKPGKMDSVEIRRFRRFFDVAAVSFPAYNDTMIVARSEEMALRNKEIYNRQMQRLNKILGGK
jgi:HK97 family phage prohead protease